ncbi:MAG: NnrS family protein [Bacteroidota bacterium]
MTLLYLALALVAALGTSLTTLSLLSPIPGQRWLLVHTVTLGVLVEMVFGLAPTLTAALSRLPRPKFHWQTWLLLNGGLILLYAGIPLVNASLITAGGTLIFFAVVSMIKQLVDLTRPGRTGGLPSPQPAEGPPRRSPGAKFYLAGLSYLLVGGLVGTGLWLGWSGPLHIAVPKEVHVHSNLWGFAALVMAGLLFDLYPRLTGLQIARHRMVTLTFWLMAAGALGLVLGPWLDIDSFTVYGLVLHTLGTLLMLISVFAPLVRKRGKWTNGVWHLVLAYVWFLLAVVVAPLVVAGGKVGAEVAGSGGPILIFGWILQAGYALFPFLSARLFHPEEPAQPGGTWLSLAASNGGSVLYWISMFLAGGQGLLRGAAYLLWIVSLIPILAGLLGLVRGRMEAFNHGD